jgi:hypothetical protein
VSLIDRYLVEGDLQLAKLPVFNETSDSSLYEGFSVELYCYYCCREGEVQPLNAIGDPGMNWDGVAPGQKGYIRCNKLERTDLGTSILYKALFEFKMDIYSIKSTRGFVVEEFNYFTTISDGKMYMEFEVPK